MHPARDNGRTRAETPPNPSRRAMLAGTTAALLAGAAIATAARGASVASPAGAGHDAELLAQAAEFHQLDAQLRRWGKKGDTTPTEVYDAIQERWWAAAERIEAIPASTKAGLAAKASIIAPVIHDTTGEPSPGERLALALARDLGAGVPPADAAPDPDAALIAICAEFLAAEVGMKRHALAQGDLWERLPG